MIGHHLMSPHPAAIVPSYCAVPLCRPIVPSHCAILLCRWRICLVNTSFGFTLVSRHVSLLTACHTDTHH